MDSMKERRDPQLRIIWGEQWVPDPVLVDPVSHLHRQWVGTTSSLTVVANNTNLVISRSNCFLSFLISLLSPLIFFCMIGKYIGNLLAY